MDQVTARGGDVITISGVESEMVAGGYHLGLTFAQPGQVPEKPV